MRIPSNAAYHHDMPLFGGRKSAAVSAYDEGQTVAVQALNAIAYAEGYSAGRGQRIDRKQMELIRWAPRTALSIMWALLKKPSTAKDLIDAGRITPSPRLATAVLIGDLFAFLAWTGADVEDSFLEFLARTRSRVITRHCSVLCMTVSPTPSSA